MKTLSPHLINKAATGKRILILGASLENAPYIQYLLEQGFNVVCADRCPADFKGQFDAYGSTFTLYAVDFSNDDLIDEIITKEHITHTLALPIGRALICLGRINDKFGFIGPSYKAIDTLTNKLSFHRFCELNELNHAQYLIVEDNSEHGLLEFYHLIEAQLQYPFIIKPAFGSGSSGVCIINNRQELLSYKVPERFVNSPLLVEQIIQGSEYSCNVFVDSYSKPHCIGMFKNGLSKPPYRQEACYFSDDYTDAFDTVYESMAKICKSLDLRQCFINADVIIDHNAQPYIVDISPRIGGNSLLRLLSFNGNHPLRFFTDCVLGDKDVLVQEQKCSVMRFFDFQNTFTYEGVTSLKTGKKSALDGSIDCCFSPADKADIISLVNNLHIGDLLGPMTNGRDVARGHIFVHKEDTASAFAMTSQYLEALT